MTATRRRWLSMGALVAAGSLGACDIDDRSLANAVSAGQPGGAGSDAGTEASAMAVPAPPLAAPTTCAAGEQRCNGQTPERCRGDGLGWEAAAPCSAERPVCVADLGACGECSPSETRACPGALGNCARGRQTCTADGLWGACDVQSAARDRCDVPGDDADCDGTPSEDCDCVEGETSACGPDAEVGICRRGTSTCSGGAWGPCLGAILPAPRDCRSSADNDCDGAPDDTLDATCQCVPDSVEACGAHPGRDGFGACRAGSRTCVPAAGFVSSNWSACTGSVGPGPRSCSSSADNDCDGLPDNTRDVVCPCAPGETRSCGELAADETRGCGTGTSVCLADPAGGAAWSDCSCGPDEYCSLPVGLCDVPELGTCTPIPDLICTAQFIPVCGCDGRTYGNACSARASGMSIDFESSCEGGNPSF